MLCPICKGRGEVSAGLTIGRDYGGYVDSDGKHQTYGEAVKVVPNPYAISLRTKDISFLDVNPLVKLWSTAICQGCEGTGMGIEKNLEIFQKFYSSLA